MTKIIYYDPVELSQSLKLDLQQIDKFYKS